MKESTPIVLIITTDISTKLFLRKHLEKNIHLIEKKSSDEAISIAENTNLDLVIIDDKIKDALELCFNLKKRKRLFTTPIILITKSLKKSFIQQALKAGVFDFLYLPLKEDLLLSILKKCEENKKRIKKVSSISSRLKNNPKK